MHLLTSTATGLILRADSVVVEYGSHEVWPDFVVVEVDGDIEVRPGLDVVDLDALPESYRCTVKQLIAALMDPVPGPLPGTFSAAEKASVREAERREKRSEECSAWGGWKAAAGKLRYVESTLQTIEYALSGTGVELESFEPYRLAKEREAALKPSEAAAKSDLAEAKQKPDAVKKVKATRG
jgi:hypothetical protein